MWVSTTVIRLRGRAISQGVDVGDRERRRDERARSSRLALADPPLIINVFDVGGGDCRSQRRERHRKWLIRSHLVVEAAGVGLSESPESRMI